MRSALKREFKKLILNRFVSFWLWAGFASFFLGGFLIITSEVQEASSGQPELIGTIDHSVVSFLLNFRNPRLNDFAVDITALGSGTVVTIFVFVASILLLLKKRNRETIHLVFAAVGSGLLTSMMKSYFERPRPDGLVHLVNVDGYSYPSGHSLTSAAVYFTFAVLICNSFQQWSRRWIIIGLFLIIIFLVGLSRVYLGVHYISDVLAGIFVGVGWAALLGAIRSYLERRKSNGF